MRFIYKPNTLISSRLFQGTIAGLVATLPMTMAMIWMQRNLPGRPVKQPLPPVEITENAAEKVNLEPIVNDRQLAGAPLVAHYAYGSAVGMFLPYITRAIPMSPVQSGMLYGLSVWAISYMGLMPKLKLYPHAKDEPKQMNGLMIISHLVWGGMAGLLIKLFEKAPLKLHAST